MNLNLSQSLRSWYVENARDLPWRKTKDPYKIWLSEVILQQTRVAQGLPYYMRFVDRYPSVEDLAEASEEEVLKLWQGLGYYSRARNLLKAAQRVVREYQGVFPSTYAMLLSLPGVGDYTASAIASICKDEAVAVLDGNVFRVLARYYGIDIPINSTEGKKRFKQKAKEVLNTEFPGEHNQAMMEFGALQCKPKSPNCEICPLRSTCVAFQTGRVNRLPVKLKKVKIKNRYFNYLVFVAPDQSILVQKRERADIWRNMYEFPLLETPRNVGKATLLEHQSIQGNEMLKNLQPRRFYKKVIKHQLSHQKLHIKFWVFPVAAANLSQLTSDRDLTQVSKEQWEKFPVPIVIHRFLMDFI